MNESRLTESLTKKQAGAQPRWDGWRKPAGLKTGKGLLPFKSTCRSVHLRLTKPSGWTEPPANVVLNASPGTNAYSLAKITPPLTAEPAPGLLPIGSAVKSAAIGMRTIPRRASGKLKADTISR